MSCTPKIVVFDLGGVLARICHTWEEALTVAQIRGTLDGSGATELTSFAGFDKYQADEIDLDSYSRDLATFVGCSPEEAVQVHNGIIQSEYADVDKIVDSLERLGFDTGCLSNTNAPHWHHLAVDGSFPTIHRLKHKMASHLVRLNKPDERIFMTFEAEFGFAPEEIVYFDDNFANAEAAQRRGWRAHRIDPALETAPQIQRVLQKEGVFPVGLFA